MTLILASGSPRRKEILSTLGLSFSVIVSDVPEEPYENEAPRAFVERLARAKALAVAKLETERFVLGADTIVVLDEKIFGKPIDDADAHRMLSSFSGRTHQVITAVALARDASVVDVRVVSTDVVFRKMTLSEITRYIETGEGRDKAGAYAVQGVGAGLVPEIRGSYLNVVGLPAVETLDMLVQAKVIESWP